MASSKWRTNTKSLAHFLRISRVAISCSLITFSVLIYMNSHAVGAGQYDTSPIYGAEIDAEAEFYFEKMKPKIIEVLNTPGKAQTCSSSAFFFVSAAAQNGAPSLGNKDTLSYYELIYKIGNFATAHYLQNGIGKDYFITLSNGESKSEDAVMARFKECSGYFNEILNLVKQ